MYEVSFKVKEIGVTIKEKRLICAVNKDEAILIVQMLNRLNGIDGRKYVAKKM